MKKVSGSSIAAGIGSERGGNPREEIHAQHEGNLVEMTSQGIRILRYSSNGSRISQMNVFKSIFFKAALSIKIFEPPAFVV